MTLPKNVDDLFQLSPMQHLMLLHAMAEEGFGVLLNNVSYDVRGPLDVDAFRGSWDDLVARHPALRTVFLWEGISHPVQVVRSTVSLDFTMVDLSSMSADERTRALDTLTRTDARTPMALGKAPLMRCALVRLGPDHHRFVWTIHHLVVDRWSYAVLFEELRSLYIARVTGIPAQLPPAPRFRDYVSWLTQQDASAAERFWRAELADFVVTSPLARERPGAASAARTTTQRSVSAAVSLAVRRMAARWRATPGAVLQSAIALLLAERSGHDDVAFGVTVSGRPPELPAVATTIGSFVNNVPSRLRLPRELTLEALVRELHRTEGRRLPFVHVSPVQLLDWSALPPGCPLFDTLVVLNLANDVDVEWPGLAFVRGSATLDAGYPFVLAVGSSGDELSLTLVYDADFAGAVETLDQLHDLLARVVSAEAGATVGDLLPALGPPATGTTAAGRATPATARDAHGPTASPTDDPMADGLLRAWREVLGVHDVGLDDDFFALGGTSLQAAQLFVRIERIAGQALPLSTLFSAGSIRGLLAELDRPVARSGALVRVRSSGTRTTLYAVPGIDGNVLSLNALARHLGRDQPFGAFESPGLDGREAPLTTIEEIAERYVEELLRVESGEIHLVGICWGAAVAFEMARRLHARGRAPARLALMDPAVLLRESEVPEPRADSRFVRERLELYWDEFRTGNWRDRSRLLASKARRAAHVLTGSEGSNGSKGSERSLGERYQVRVREANTVAVRRYLPRRYEGEARLFVTAGRELGGGDDPRLEWVGLLVPEPAVVPIEGINSGDAISPARAGSFVQALQSWLWDAGRAAP